MTKTNTCTINILNKAYQIKCPEAEVDNLHLATQKLNEHIANKKSDFKHLSDFQALLLASLHISHELIMSQKQHTLQRQQLAHFIHSLESKINQVAEEK